MFVCCLQAEHGLKKPIEDTGLTSMLREQTKLRTMGAPIPRVDMKQLELDAHQHQHQHSKSSPQQHAHDKDQCEVIDGIEDDADGSNRSVVELVFKASGKGQRPFTARPSTARSRAGGDKPPGHSAMMNSARSMPSRPSSACEFRNPRVDQQKQHLLIANNTQTKSSSTSYVNAVAGTSATQPPSKVKMNGPPVRTEKETFRSKLPIKWAAASNMQLTTTYTSAFGSLVGGGNKQLAGAGKTVENFPNAPHELCSGVLKPNNATTLKFHAASVDV